MDVCFVFEDSVDVIKSILIGERVIGNSEWNLIAKELKAFELTVKEKSATQVFVLLKAQSDEFEKFINRLQEQEFLLGVYKASHSRITFADRQRITIDMLRSHRCLDKFDIFPIQDTEFNKRWLKEWTKTWWITERHVDAIREQYGEAVGYYFAFLRFYFIWLSIPSVFAILTNQQVSPLYAIGIVVWSTLFIIFWKIKEKELSVRWETRNVCCISRRRQEFYAESEIVDPVTAQAIPYYPPWKRWVTRAATAPLILAFVVMFGLLQCSILAMQILFAEKYNGPFSSVLKLFNKLYFLPTIIYSTSIPYIGAKYYSLATLMTDYENHESQEDYDAALAQKVFLSSIVTNFLSLFMIGFVFIPFHSSLQSVLKLYWIESATTPITFERLQNELFYFVVTGQAVNAATEVLLPVIQRRFLQKKAVSNLTNKIQDQLQNEYDLPVYDTHEDYSEMITQFGYVSAFSVIWPLASLACLVNNFIELRSDAVKICIHTRKPLPRRVENMGPWLRNLYLFTWLSSITNGLLVCFYKFRIEDQTTTLLIVVLSEHIFFVAVYIFSSIINSFRFWADEEMQRREFQIKSQSNK